jgi:multisubunit Na+/H+ antiporter MnhB subunit
MTRSEKSISRSARTFITTGSINTELVTIAPLFTFIQIYTTALIFGINSHPILAITGAAVERSSTQVLTG